MTSLCYMWYFAMFSEIMQAAILFRAPYLHRQKRIIDQIYFIQHDKHNILETTYSKS